MHKSTHIENTFTHCAHSKQKQSHACYNWHINPNWSDDSDLHLPLYLPSLLSAHSLNYNVYCNDSIPFPFSTSNINIWLYSSTFVYLQVMSHKCPFSDICFVKLWSYPNIKSTYSYTWHITNVTQYWIGTKPIFSSSWLDNSNRS